MRMSVRMVPWLLGLMLAIVAVQGLRPLDRVPPPRSMPPPEQCRGAPIRVDFAFNGSVNEPWTCQVQCEDSLPRYILYSNGKATQCEAPPGCNDYGEDRGITCVPPVASSSE